MMDFDYSNFHAYKKAAMKTLRIAASRQHPGTMDEQGIPAYLEGSYWSRWVFWRRTYLASQFISERPAGGQCVDFGCGSGVMLPLLASQFETISAIDIRLDLAQDFARLWTEYTCHDLTGIRYYDSLESADIRANSIDLILALDSLEHVDILQDVLAGMNRLLKPGGHLLISGPTENLFYRLGRKIAGFSGHYHHRSVYDIEKAVSKLFQIRSVKNVRFPFSLFLVIDVQKR